MFFKSIIRNILSATGTYDLLRRFYYSRRKTSCEIFGISGLFWTTTPAMNDRISLAGGEKYQLETFIKRISRKVMLFGMLGLI